MAFANSSAAYSIGSTYKKSPLKNLLQQKRADYKSQLHLDKGKLATSIGISLFSHLVAKALSSAPLSLTSVFGMGTGGPSASSTPINL